MVCHAAHFDVYDPILAQTCIAGTHVLSYLKKMCVSQRVFLFVLSNFLANNSGSVHAQVTVVLSRFMF